jgi:TIR domain
LPATLYFLSNGATIQMSKVTVMQVFISHAAADKGIAKKIATVLEKENFKVWYDRDILPGQNWADEIAKALRRSRAMIVLLTPASLGSESVLREIQYALGEETYSHRLIPVIVGSPEKLPKKDIPWILQSRSFQTITLPEHGGSDREIKRIAEVLKAA